MCDIIGAESDEQETIAIHHPPLKNENSGSGNFKKKCDFILFILFLQLNVVEYLDLHEELHLCKLRPSSKRQGAQSCSRKKYPQKGRILVVGSLHFLGSKLVSHLSTNSTAVDAVADYKDVLNSVDGMEWYRADMLLLHHRLKIKFANLTNQTQVKNLIGERRVSTVVFVPPPKILNYNVSSGNKINVHFKVESILSDYLRYFVTILEAVRESSPCTKIVLISETESKSHHAAQRSWAKSWITTLELVLSNYRYYYEIPITIVRVHSVFGPWDENVVKHVMESRSKDPQMGGNCWYVDNVMAVIVGAIQSTKKCQLVHLGGCPENIKAENEQYMEKTWSWARSYAEDKYGKRKRPQNNLVFTSYFTTSEDYQRKRFKSKDSFWYMKDFYFSVKEKNMKAVVFHDGLDQSFQHKVHSYYQNVTFIKVESLHGRTTNDARFYAYYEYLLEHSDVTSVLLTDISDVVFSRDPFELMSLLGDWLYVGTDIDIFPNMASMPWIKKRLGSCFGDYSVGAQGELYNLMKMDTVYNAGTIGGTRERVLAALVTILTYLDMAPTQLNCNMPAVNYAMHKHFFDNIFTGFPLNSRFFRKQHSAKGVYIIHK